MKKASFRFQNPSKFFLLIYIALGEMEGGYDAHRGSLWTTPVCPPTGTALAVGPAAQQGGRRKAAPFHSFSAPQPDSLDPGRGPSILFTGWGQGSISGATLAATSPLGKVMNPGHVGLENCKSLGGRAHQLLPETSGECREGHKTESGMASARRQLSGSACSRVLKPGNGSARFPLSPPWWY